MSTSLESGTLRRNPRNHQVKQFHGRSVRSLNYRAFGRTEIDARAFRHVVILIVEIDFTLAFHRVDELIFVGRLRFELPARLNPAQSPADILSPHKTRIQD